MPRSSNNQRDDPSESVYKHPNGINDGQMHSHTDEFHDRCENGILFVPSPGNEVIPRSVSEAVNDERGKDEEGTEDDGFEEGAVEYGENIVETTAQIGGAFFVAFQGEDEGINHCGCIGTASGTG